MQNSHVESKETIFEGIFNGKFSAKWLYKDDEIGAFYDIAPQAPIHFLVVPKKPIINLTENPQQHEELFGRLLRLAAELAEKLGLHETGYRVLINNGSDANQEVQHLHLHVLGGENLGLLNAKSKSC